MKSVIPKSKRPLPKVKHKDLRAHPEQDHAWDRLPFVGKDHSKHASSWDLPMIGGFFGGIEAGRVVCRMYLKYLRDERDNPISLSKGRLAEMLSSLACRQPVTKEEEASVQGQRTGFLHELSYWLEAAAFKQAGCLDAIPLRTFVGMANEALQADDASFMAAIEAKGVK